VTTNADYAKHDDDSLVNRIERAIQNDDDDQSARLTDLYEKASMPQKGLLDEAFICLCGWSLETLIAGKETS
jgi:hypothetical protein